MATPMRGASADALAALTSSLVDRLQGGADASRIGEDLFSVSSLLRTEASLRRVATDASLEAAAKKSLVDGLLSAKVDPVALELISDAVGRRWTVARDLADALEHSERDFRWCALQALKRLDWPTSSSRSAR